MNRKKWTAQEEVTDSLLKFREKRKWQLAFRRYVVEKAPSMAYAPYFGLSIEEYRKWIELQFTGILNWDNFGTHWQFDHIVPVANFDYSNDDDLKLCWNFINIRVSELLPNTQGHTIAPIAAKAYFENLYKKTGISFSLKMIEKINLIEIASVVEEPNIERFILDNKENIETLNTLTPDEFNNLNAGMALKDILLEKEILKKFGS